MTTDGLTQSDTGCFYSCTHTATVGVKGFNHFVCEYLYLSVSLSVTLSVCLLLCPSVCVCSAQVWPILAWVGIKDVWQLDGRAHLYGTVCRLQNTNSATEQGIFIVVYRDRCMCVYQSCCATIKFIVSVELSLFFSCSYFWFFFTDRSFILWFWFDDVGRILAWIWLTWWLAAWTALLRVCIQNTELILVTNEKVLSRASWAHRAALISVSCSPQPDTSRSCKTTDTGLVHRVVCPFTPQLSLVLINRPRRDGTLSWHWCTAATGRNRTHDLTIGKSGTVPRTNESGTVPRTNE